MTNPFPKITFTPGDLDFIEEVVEFLQEILDAVRGDDDDDE